MLQKSQQMHFKDFFGIKSGGKEKLQVVPACRGPLELMHTYSFNSALALFKQNLFRHFVIVWVDIYSMLRPFKQPSGGRIIRVKRFRTGTWELQSWSVSMNCTAEHSARQLLPRDALFCRS